MAACFWIGLSAAGKICLYVSYFKMKKHVEYGNQIFEFFQFICLGSLAFLFVL